MRILGIDPGLATTGWAIVDINGKDYDVVEFGVIETGKGLELGERLDEIFSDLKEIIEKFKPEKAAVETLLFCNNAKTAIAVGEARGVLLLCLEQSGLPVEEFSPLQVKNNITGFGKADKRQVQECVRLLCGLDVLPRPDDAADAVAVAISCQGVEGL
ncbi:crossover junction endodeoxyribonuclease RuvC [Candidatus Dojkabacteria bacterium]|nr:crossover junction endodeoxyribonuclease RuvC [Candidatus Dojkabacteria bacterium]